MLATIREYIRFNILIKTIKNEKSKICYVYKQRFCVLYINSVYEKPPIK